MVFVFFIRIVGGVNHPKQVFLLSELSKYPGKIGPAVYFQS